MKSRRRGRDLLPRWVTLVVLSFLLYSPNAIAGVTGKITGVVTDSETGEPLVGANVIIEGTTMGAAADPDGYFSILNVPPDIYDIRASMMDGLRKCNEDRCRGYNRPHNSNQI